MTIYANSVYYVVEAESLNVGSGVLNEVFTLVDEDGNTLVDEEGGILVGETPVTIYGDLLYANATNYLLVADMGFYPIYADATNYIVEAEGGEFGSGTLVFSYYLTENNGNRLTNQDGDYLFIPSTVTVYGEVLYSRETRYSLEFDTIISDGLLARDTSYVVEADRAPLGAGTLTFYFTLVDEESNILTDENGNVLVSEEMVAVFGETLYADYANYMMEV